MNTLVEIADAVYEYVEQLMKIKEEYSDVINES